MELGMPEDDLLARLRAYQEQGYMRRFGAILRHQIAGFIANGMSVWNVPDHEVERVGALMAHTRKSVIATSARACRSGHITSLR